MFVQVTDRFFLGHSNDHLTILGSSSQKNPPPATAQAALLGNES